MVRSASRVPVPRAPLTVPAAPMNLASPADVSDILRRHRLRPRHRFGQNFLIDANLLAKVVEAAELQPTDGVLEIGPGLGVLTEALAAVARQVTAVEIDRDLYAVLSEETLRYVPNARVVLSDFLDVDLEQSVPEWLGPGRHAVVANIPYSITTPVLVRVLRHYPLFHRAVLMVQKEVADRLIAAPGSEHYGSLTVFVHHYADARRVAHVPRRAFLPAPKVDSAIIRLDIRPEPRFPDIPTERYEAVVQASFQQRRKTLLNSLTGPKLGWSREQALAALAGANIDPVRRGETLTPDEFAAVARIGPHG